MNRFISVLNRILKDRLLLRRWRRSVTILASVVVFVTTYMLILPAISVEKENVESVSGIYLEDAEVIDQEHSIYTNPASDEVVTDAPLVQMQKAHAGNHAESADKHQLYAYGDAYKIVVTYDDKSGIPDSAHLEVQEITQDPEAYASREVSEYDEYVDNTVNALGWESALR